MFSYDVTPSNWSWVPGIFLGVKGGRRVGLTTSPPSVSRCLENMGASTSHNPMRLHGPLPGYLHPFFTVHIIFIVSRDSSKSVPTRVRSEDSGFDFRKGQGTILFHSVYTAPGAHPASYKMGFGDKAARAWIPLITSI
jgi:hypothetical protein